MTILLAAAACVAHANPLGAVEDVFQQLPDDPWFASRMAFRVFGDPRYTQVPPACAAAIRTWEGADPALAGVTLYHTLRDCPETCAGPVSAWDRADGAQAFARCDAASETMFGGPVVGVRAALDPYQALLLQMLVDRSIAAGDPAARWDALRPKLVVGVLLDALPAFGDRVEVRTFGALTVPPATTERVHRALATCAAGRSGAARLVVDGTGRTLGSRGSAACNHVLDGITVPAPTDGQWAVVDWTVPRAPTPPVTWEPAAPGPRVEVISGSADPTEVAQILELALIRHPCPSSTHGSLVVEWTVATDGTVASTRVVDDPLGGTASACVAARLGKTLFPEPSGGPSVVRGTIPL